MQDRGRNDDIIERYYRINRQRFDQEKALEPGYASTKKKPLIRQSTKDQLHRYPHRDNQKKETPWI